jgi:hypothetical protein
LQPVSDKRRSPDWRASASSARPPGSADGSSPEECSRTHPVAPVLPTSPGSPKQYQMNLPLCWIGTWAENAVGPMPFLTSAAEVQAVSSSECAGLSAPVYCCFTSFPACQPNSWGHSRSKWSQTVTSASAVLDTRYRGREWRTENDKRAPADSRRRNAKRTHGAPAGDPSGRSSPPHPVHSTRLPSARPYSRLCSGWVPKLTCSQAAGRPELLSAEPAQIQVFQRASLPQRRFVFIAIKPIKAYRPFEPSPS